jgi:hypothetical protein
MNKRSSVWSPLPCTFTNPALKVIRTPGQIKNIKADSLYAIMMPTIVIAPEMRIADLRFLFIRSVEPTFSTDVPKSVISLFSTTAALDSVLPLSPASGSARLLVLL